MSLSLETVLPSMKQSFPSWSDIRKRTDKSVGGALIKSYAREADYIQDAINEYRKLFFLLNYKDHEEEFADYLYIATVGKQNEISVVGFPCQVTEDDDLFYNNMDKMALYKNGYLMFHENILPNGAEQKTVQYKTENKNVYEAELHKEHIWNAFDEFALFAGLTRYGNETNSELAARTVQIFKEFPNPTGDGLRNAVKDAIAPHEKIEDEAIDIYTFGDKKFTLSREDHRAMYEDMVQLNRDIFRAKVWNRDIWEHGFQKTDYIPHVWDAPMEAVQNGVGYNDSLRADYIKRLGQSETTDIEVNAYKKDFERIRQYIGRTNVEASIQLTLTKYTDEVNPKNVEFCVRAYDVKKIDKPENIHVLGTRKQNGEKRYYVDDLDVETYGVTRVEGNHLEENASYKLKFTPKDTFAGMSIEKCALVSDSGEKDLRKEYSYYKMQNGSIVNQNVAAHVTSTAQITINHNVEDCSTGITVGHGDSKGLFGVDVTGMGKELVNYSVACRRIDITSSSYIEGRNGFEISEDGKSFESTRPDSLGQIIIGGQGREMSCNSYSFTLDKSDIPALQGAITVTEIVDGQVTQMTYRQPQDIVREFKKRSTVQVIIQKYGQNPVKIKNIAMASYDVNVGLSDGTPLTMSGKTIRLPENVDGKVLNVEIIPYTAAYPVVEYLHIGGSLKGARYEVDFNTDGLKNPKLDIDTDCNITLYKKSGGSSILVGDEYKYTTKARFKNTTSDPGQIILDLSDFASISSASQKIKDQYKGMNKKYIELAPGEEIFEMDITGEVIRQVTNKPILWHLFGDDTKNKELYATRGTNGYILVKDTESGETKKVTIRYEDLDGRADSYQLTGLSHELSAEFVTANGEIRETVNSGTGSIFDHLGITYKQASEYVAYNTFSMIREKQSGVELVNTFTPVMSMTELKYYVIASTKNAREDKVCFETSGDNWSLGVDEKGISITTVLETKNADSWIISINNVNNRYILANEVPLEERYFIEQDNMYHDLREYMVFTEPGLVVNYEIEPGIEENIVVKEKLVNKLKFSNINDLKVYQGNALLTSGYEVMKDEGLIIWSDERYLGIPLRIVYSIRRASTVSYTKEYEDKLYNLVNFSAEAYKLIGTNTYKNCPDGARYNLRFDEEPDKIITACTNASFSTSILNGVLTAARITDEDKIAVHNGYIYDQGREYYYFSDIFNDRVDAFSNIELHDVSRMNGELLFHMRSTNYLPYSNMRTSVMAKLCSVDLTKRLPKGISKAAHQTACESFNLWHNINMKVALTENGMNSYGLNFKSADKTGGYAALDITSFYIEGHAISLYIVGDLKASIVKETQVDGLTMTKSIFLETKDGYELEREKDLAYGICGKPEKNCRYFLVLSGTSGTIDDIVSLPYTDLKGIKESHRKNINKLNFNIAEKMPEKYECDLEFDIAGAAYKDLNIHSQTKEIETSANVEYGLTLAESIDLEQCLISRMQLKKGTLITTLDGGSARTPVFFTHTKSSIYALYVKVNDIIEGQYKGFTIKLYGSNTRSGGYTLLATEENANLLSIPHNLVRNYYYVEVIANKNKVIHSIDVYARYAETEDGGMLAPTRISQGTFISKIYDMGEKANYILKDICYKTNNQDEYVEFYIRGAREGKSNLVFTPWRKYAANSDKLKEIRYDDYSLFQFKINVNSPTVTLTVDKFRMVVAS